MPYEIDLARLLTSSPQCEDLPGSCRIEGGTFHRFLSAAGSAESKDCLEAELELEIPSCITTIEVGNFCSAFIEILVKSRTASDFVHLLSAKSLMSPVDSKMGRRRNDVRTFGPSMLNKSALSQTWNTVLIQCRQPYRPGQFGLSFIKFYNGDVGPRPKGLLSPPSLNSIGLSSDGGQASPSLTDVFVGGSSLKSTPTLPFVRAELLRGRKPLPSANVQKLTGRTGPRKRRLTQRNLHLEEDDDESEESYMRSSLVKRKAEFSSSTQSCGKKSSWLLGTKEQSPSKRPSRPLMKHKGNRKGKAAANFPSTGTGLKITDLFKPVQHEDDNAMEESPLTLRGMSTDTSSQPEMEEWGACPICGQSFPMGSLPVHASVCGDEGNYPEIIEIS
eukprot:m.11023 g.11023  ORF g.11023 m.11023 type:complete len:389 (+) comp22906_c0_seq2:35-1201(+)